MHVSSVSSAFRCMLQVLHPNILKIDRVLHLCLHFSTASPSPRCLLLLVLPAGHLPPPSPLLDADIANCCSHLLQLMAACMRVRSGGGASGDSLRAVGRYGPCIGGRGMQARRGRRSAGASVHTNVPDLTNQVELRSSHNVS